MWSKGDAASPVGLIQWIFRQHVGDGTVAVVMAFHAEATGAGVRYHGAIGERNIIAHAQLVWIGSVRAGCGRPGQCDRLVGCVRGGG